MADPEPDRLRTPRDGRPYAGLEDCEIRILNSVIEGFVIRWPKPDRSLVGTPVPGRPQRIDTEFPIQWHNPSPHGCHCEPVEHWRGNPYSHKFFLNLAFSLGERIATSGFRPPRNDMLSGGCRSEWQTLNLQGWRAVYNRPYIGVGGL